MYLDINLPPENGQVGLFLLTPDHVTNDYVGWLNNPAVNQYLESRYTTHSVESTRAFVASTLESPDNLFLGIWAPGSEMHVGNIKLGPINRQHRTGEIGILIGDRRVWGKGVGTSAIARLSHIARERLGLRKVTAGCYASNIGSRKAFENAGFLLEGIRPRQLLLNGQPDDLVLLGKCLD